MMLNRRVSPSSAKPRRSSVDAPSIEGSVLAGGVRASATADSGGLHAFSGLVSPIDRVFCPASPPIGGWDALTECTSLGLPGTRPRARRFVTSQLAPSRAG